MTITFSWWLLPILFLLFPFIFRLIRPYQNTGGYLGNADFVGFFVICISWAIAIGLFIGHFI